MEDLLIRLTGNKSSKLYPKEFRLIKYCDFETGEGLSFITNVTDQLDLNGLETSNMYRHRWDIECFFKLIKQNLTIKHLWGCSVNAVRTHLWVAICSYLLLARVKAIYNSPYSITEIATLVSVSALAKTDLKELVTEPQPLIQNQNVNELTLFKKINASVVIQSLKLTHNYFTLPILVNLINFRLNNQYKYWVALFCYLSSGHFCKEFICFLLFRFGCRCIFRIIKC